MRISDWSSDVCSSDLPVAMAAGIAQLKVLQGSGFYKTLNSRTSEFVASVQRFADARNYPLRIQTAGSLFWFAFASREEIRSAQAIDPESMQLFRVFHRELLNKSEEHTSELQSLMRISYAVFCLKKK